VEHVGESNGVFSYSVCQKKKKVAFFINIYHLYHVYNIDLLYKNIYQRNEQNKVNYKIEIERNLLY
jgi:hypothetical protein